MQDSNFQLFFEISSLIFLASVSCANVGPLNEAYVFCTTCRHYTAIGVATMSVLISAVSPMKSLEKFLTDFFVRFSWDRGPR